MTQLAQRLPDDTVASGILNIFSRSPGLIAMTAAALGDIGNGFTLGLGASGPAVIENFHGKSFDRPLRRTREYIEIVNALLDGDTLNYSGEIFELSGFSLEEPVEAEVPVYVAAMGENNLRLTGEFADGWLPLFVPIHEMDEALASIREGATRRGRSLDAIDIAPYIITCISEADPQEARDQVRAMLAFYLGGMGDFYYRTVSRFGYGDEAESIRSAWKVGNTDEAESAVTDEMLAAFAIAGSPSRAAERIAAYESAGVDMPVAYVPTRAPTELISETIDLFSRL